MLVGMLSSRGQRRSHVVWCNMRQFLQEFVALWELAAQAAPKAENLTALSRVDVEQVGEGCGQRMRHVAAPCLAARRKSHR